MVHFFIMAAAPGALEFYYSGCTRCTLNFIMAAAPGFSGLRFAPALCYAKEPSPSNPCRDSTIVNPSVSEEFSRLLWGDKKSPYIYMYTHPGGWMQTIQKETA
jgi:hypothetical protein